MNLVTLAMAKAYTDSKCSDGGAGYSNIVKMTFSTDDTIDDTDLLVFGGAYLRRISENAIDTSSVISVTYQIDFKDGDSSVVTCTKDDLQISNDGPISVVGTMLDDNGIVLILSVSEDFAYEEDRISKGSYILWISSEPGALGIANWFVSTIEYEEVSKIDPKYLPGVTEIRPADYGIDIVALVNSGVKLTSISGTDKLWEKVNNTHDFCFIADTETEVLSIVPQMIVRSKEWNNEIESLGFAVQFGVGDAVVVANVVLKNALGLTYFYCGSNAFSLE